MANNPVIPQIAQAFQNDPRTKLAQAMIATGGSTAPVAGGGWGVTDGLARALQGVVGGYVQSRQQKKYAGEEQQYMSAIANALSQQPQGAQGGAPVGAPPVAQPPMAPAAAMTPPPAASMAPGAAAGAPQGDLQGWLAGLPASPRMTPQPRPATAVGGAPSRFNSAQLATAAREFIPGVTVTSGVRTARHNAEVGGVPNSQHVRGTAIDIVPPRGMSPDQVRAQYAARGAQVDVINEGDHYHIQGARNPQRVAASQAAASSVGTPASEPFTPPQSVTPDPAPVERPVAPELPATTQSRQLALGRSLIGSSNRFAFMDGKDYIDKGLVEQGKFDETGAERQFQQGQTRYGSELANFNAASGDARNATYQQQRDERTFAFQDQQAEKEFGRQLTRDERQYAHDMRRAGFDRETQFGLARLNNDADLQRTMLTIAGQRATADEKAAARRTAFLSTATGAKIADAAQQRINNNNGVIDDVQEFLRLNQQQTTGGSVLGTRAGAFLPTWLGGNSNLQSMEAITAKLAPMLRQAGSGAMSDKDLAGFRASLPSIQSTGRANSSIGQRMIRSLQRVNDYEMSRLDAMQQGTTAEFNHDWQAFREAVPVASGKSYSEWRSSLRTVR